MTYLLINKPWEARKLLRAYRLRRAWERRDEQDLMAWASNLVQSRS